APGREGRAERQLDPRLPAEQPGPRNVPARRGVSPTVGKDLRGMAPGLRDRPYERHQGGQREKRRRARKGGGLPRGRFDRPHRHREERPEFTTASRRGGGVDRLPGKSAAVILLPGQIPTGRYLASLRT